MNRIAQKRCNFRTVDTRLLAYLAHGAGFGTLARLDMPFGQVPAVAAAYHQQPALLVSDDAAGSLDDEQLREQMRERCVGVGRNDGDEFVRLDFFDYIRSRDPAVVGRKHRIALCGAAVGDDHARIGKI